MQSKTLIVVGMHRSGTSLASNWLHKCGLQLGERMLGANDGNKEGHFEDIEFLKMHEEILSSNDLAPSGLVYSSDIDVSVYQLEKLKSIIKVKNQRFKQWGWKEPRTCLFLNLYKKLLPGSKYLIITRDYLSVVNSLLKRDFDELGKLYSSRNLIQRMIWSYFRKNRRKKEFYRDNAEYYLKVWIDYNEHILITLQELPAEDYIVVNYKLLTKCDIKVFSVLTDVWNFTLNYCSFRDVYKESLIGNLENLTPFIKDRVLLSEAKTIEDSFDKYLMTC